MSTSDPGLDDRSGLEGSAGVCNWLSGSAIEVGAARLARVCSDRAAPSAPGVFLTVSGERAPSVALWSVRGGIGEEPGRRGVTMRASNRVNEPRPSPRPVQEGLTTEAGRQTTGVFLG